MGYFIGVDLNEAFFVVINQIHQLGLRRHMAFQVNIILKNNEVLTTSLFFYGV